MKISNDLTPRRWRAIGAIPFFAAGMLVAGCGGSSGGTPQPDPIVNDTSTADLKSNASRNIGGSLDASLDGVSRVTSGGGGDGFDDPADTGIGGLWSNDAQSLVNTSLDLGTEENTVREGTRITIDPDDAAVCSEELVSMNADQAEFERCQALVGDMLVQIDATSDTAGTLTYLFQNQQLAAVGYAANSNSFELNLGTLKSLIDAEAALNPEVSEESPLDTIQGAIRMSAIATNQTSGSEAGSVALEVSQPLVIASADAGNSFSLGTGKILGMSADAGNESATIEIALGALQASETDEYNGAINSIDMKGLTATIDIANNANQLVVRNLGIGQGPLSIALDNAEVVNLGLDTFGFNVSMENGDITLTGGLNLRFLVNQVFEDNTVSNTLFSLLEMTAPAGTQLSEQFNGSLMVASGGPLNYSLTTQDENGNPVINQVTVNAGQCADEDGFSGDQQLVNCQ